LSEFTFQLWLTVKFLFSSDGSEAAGRGYTRQAGLLRLEANPQKRVSLLLVRDAFNRRCLPQLVTGSATSHGPAEEATLPPEPLAVAGSAAIGREPSAANLAMVYVIDVSGSVNVAATIGVMCDVGNAILGKKNFKVQAAKSIL